MKTLKRAKVTLGFVVLSFALSISSGWAENEPIKPAFQAIIVLDLMDRRASAQMTMDVLSAQYPGAHQFILSAKDNVDLKNQLNKLMTKNQVSIVALEIDSHGASGAQAPETIDGIMKYGEEFSFINKADGQVAVNLMNPVGSALDPMRGHFADGAKIIFMGCEVAKLYKGDLKKQTDFMRDLAHYFQLKQGTIYANETLGKTPYRNLADFSHWPNGTIAFSVFEYAVQNWTGANQGISLFVKTAPNGDRTYTLMKDKLFDAEARQSPVVSSRMESEKNFVPTVRSAHAEALGVKASAKLAR